jgi:hypothetical protein
LSLKTIEQNPNNKVGKGEKRGERITIIFKSPYCLHQKPGQGVLRNNSVKESQYKPVGVAYGRMMQLGFRKEWDQRHGCEQGGPFSHLHHSFSWHIFLSL